MTPNPRSGWYKITPFNIGRYRTCDGLKRPDRPQCTHEFKVGDKFYRTSMFRILCESCGLQLNSPNVKIE